MFGECAEAYATKIVTNLIEMLGIELCMCQSRGGHTIQLTCNCATVSPTLCRFTFDVQEGEGERISKRRGLERGHQSDKQSLNTAT